MVVPKAVARLDTQRRVWVVVECPYCGRRNRHQHGAGRDSDDPQAFLGNRVADCGGIVGTYDLVDAGVPYEASPTPIWQTERGPVLARKSGLSARMWNREYRGRHKPLTEEERRARGDQLGLVSGW